MRCLASRCLSGALAILPATLLAGCVSPEQQIEQARQVAVRDDQFRPQREYATGAITTADNTHRTIQVLLARIDRRTGALSIALQVRTGYIAHTYRRYETARNERAEPLLLRQISKDVSNCRRPVGCVHTELIEIELQEAVLRQAPQAGYRLKYFPRVGPDGTALISKSLIQALLEKIDADRRALASATE